MEVTYLIDGVNLNTYGVYVSGSKGLLSRPKAKTPLSQSWQDYHGEVVDLSRKYYESRKITLKCFLKATSNEDFINKTNTFLALLDTPGTRRLMVSVDSAKSLVFEVYVLDEVDPDKEWHSGKMTGTFNLNLIEHSPIKKVLKHIRTDVASKTASITITSAKLVDIYWGDGAVTNDVFGTNQTITHDYAANGTYHIIVAGCIDEITSLTSNATVVWIKL